MSQLRTRDTPRDPPLRFGPDRFRFARRALRNRGGGAGASTVTLDQLVERVKFNEDGHATEQAIRQAAARDATEMMLSPRWVGVNTPAAITQAVETLVERLGDRSHVSRASLHGTSAGLKLFLPPCKGLCAHDFSALFNEKLAAHLPGTREWAFAAIVEWLNGTSTSPLFWLMGGGGTGKSVLTATLHQRVSEQVVAWHYCRHDEPQASAPAALLRSLATMLCHRLPG